MSQTDSATPSKYFVRDSFQSFTRTNGVLEEPLTLGRPKLPMEENYWPVKPWTPTCDVYETDREIVLKFELPEVRTEDLSVTMESHLLTVCGERKFQEETNRENYRRVERHYGQFIRCFNVPVFVDATKISAEFKYGVLTVRLKKREEHTAIKTNH